MASLEKLVLKAKEHFDENEEAIASVKGAYETKIMGSDSVRNGVFVATSKRVVFYAKKITGYEMEVFPYSTISSIEHGKGLMGHKITLFASGNKATVKWIKEGDIDSFVGEVKSRIGKKEASSETPSQLPADIPAQIKQLAELKDQGILTEEEFETKKAELLKKI